MPRRAALAGVTLWLCLPSTVVITEFLSTRHYLEGLLLGIIAVSFGFASVSGEPKKAARRACFAGIFYLLACTTKEVYVSAVWVILLLLYLDARRFSALLGTIACGVLYAAYRFWSLGLVGKNLGGSFLEDYHLFLARIPYLFTGNWGGYPVLAAGLILLVVLWRQGKVTWKHLFFMAAVYGVMLLTIFPVSAPVTHQYKDLGTWYRIVFLLNSFTLVCLAWLVSRLKNPNLVLAGFLIALLLVLPSTYKTSKLWDANKARYQSDARFYLDHPDRLLYSKLPATWFLYGVHNLYLPDQPQHYLTWRVNNGTPKDYLYQKAQPGVELWLEHEGRYIADTTLADIIRENLDGDKTPLHKGWQPPE